jgi:hypothetical protein
MLNVIRFLLASTMVVPLSCNTVDAPTKLTLLVVVVKYVEEIVPIFERFPLASILWVPAPAPVLMPVVPLRVVPVMVLAVAMVPKPEAMEPEDRAPVLVREEFTIPEPRVVEDKTLVPPI